MSEPLWPIVSIIGLGVLNVLLPQFLGVVRRWPTPRSVTPPEKGGKATTGISPYYAAFTSFLIVNGDV